MMAYIRPPLKGIPIREKKIKGKLYAYQRVQAWRDPDTGHVRVQDRYLGAVDPARPEPMMNLLDATDIDIITVAWQRGETIEWLQTYLRTAIGEIPAPDTIYKWLRAHGIKRDYSAKKVITAAEMRLARVKRLKAEDAERKARQARRRAQARKEIEKTRR